MLRAGILYRLADFLLAVSSGRNTRRGLLTALPTCSGVASEHMLAASTAGGWVEVDSEGCLLVTPSGRRILAEGNVALRLRLAVQDLVGRLRPSWARLAVQGRQAAERYAPGEAVQCLRESGLLAGTDEAVVRWWDNLAEAGRSERAGSRTAIGRAGERLSCDYETLRTGIRPEWTALAYAGAGYDIRSRLSDTDPAPLYIEVKASVRGWAEAELFVTSAEWSVLRGPAHCLLHLWCLEGPTPQVAVLGAGTLERHLPRDAGAGSWQSARIPFRALAEHSSAWRAVAV